MMFVLAVAWYRASVLASYIIECTAYAGLAVLGVAFIVDMCWPSTRWFAFYVEDTPEHYGLTLHCDCDAIEASQICTVCAQLHTTLQWMRSPVLRVLFGEPGYDRVGSVLMRAAKADPDQPARRHFLLGTIARYGKPKSE
jgi:hypothetical protein